MGEIEQRMRQKRFRKWCAIGLVCSLLAGWLPPGERSAAAASAPAPELLITELVPDTKNLPNLSVDGYEFIEVYNNSSEKVNFKDYGLFYVNNGAGTQWTLTSGGDAFIDPGKAIVLWVMNNDNTSETAEAFNGVFGTGLIENVDLFRVNGGGGMHNSSPRTLQIRDRDGNVIVSASYDNDDQTKPDKGIFYQHPAPGSTAMVMMPNPGTVPANPGSVQPEQLVPYAEGSAVTIAHTPAAETTDDADYVVSADIAGAEQSVSASVYYKTDTAGTYSAIPMSVSGAVYQAAVPKEALAGSSLLSYYIEAQDGDRDPVRTAEYTVRIVKRPEAAGQLPPLLITELLPNSSNVNGADGYEFIEVYNNTDREFHFKDYKIYYRYTDSGPEADVVWPTDREDLVIAPMHTMVFWVINSANRDLTVDDFNRAFGTNLAEGTDIVKVYSDGMANTSRRGIVIGTNTHKEVVSAYYDGSLSNVENKGTHYMYPAEGTTMTPLSTGTVAASPGTVTSAQIPAQPVSVREDTEAPTLQDRTGVTEIDQSQSLEIVADAQDDQQVKSVALYYKTDRDNEYTKRYLYEDYNDTMYHYTVSSPEMIGRAYVSYYFEVSDGTHTVVSDVRQVAIRSSLDSSPVRLNVKDGDVLSGTSVIKAAANGLDADDLKLSVDGHEVADTYRALEHDAFFAFEATEVNYYFKNAVTMGNDILYTFLDPINAYTTLTFPIEAARLHEGRNVISIRAGSKSGPFDDRPEENKDDFKIRNVRLVLADGTVLYDPAYADRNQELKMGDSAGRNEAIDFTFELNASHLGAKAYNWDTTSAADGKHRLAVTAPGGASAEAEVTIDNTAPAIRPSVEEGKTYRGAFTLDAAATDALAGVRSVEASLDGEAIALPYETSSGKLAGGTHTLYIKATDHAGNVNEVTVRFDVPNENPDKPALISPQNGQENVSLQPDLTVTVKDPTDDPMSATFYRGFRYDSNRKDGFRGFAGASDTEPPKQLQPGGEQPMSADDYGKIGAADGQYLVSDSSDRFPYQRFELTLDPSVKPTDRVDIEWKGHSLEGRKVSLYAWSPAASKWVPLDSEIAGREDFTLSATVKAGDYNADGQIHVMIQDEMPQSQDPYDFTFVWMSDTQYYSESYPEIYKKNVQWVVDQQQAMNIRYVIHTGDIVDDADQEYQWINANEAMKPLDESGIPYGVLAGNHDVSHQSGDYSHFWAHYGEDRFKNQPTYGGSYQNNRGHYDLISAGGNDFIIVYMGWNIGDDEIDWVNDVVKQYPDRKAILAFHEYLLVSGNRAPIADKIFERVVVPNKNVIATLSGHYHDAETLVDEIDDNGDGIPDRKVYQILADYQGAEMGGLGYIRLLQFDLDHNKIHVKTYSPYLDDYNYYDPAEYPGKDEFDMDVDLGAMNKRVATDYFAANVYTDQLIGKAEHVQSGSRATVKWTGLEANRHYEWYVLAQDDHSGSTLSDIWGFYTGQNGGGPVNPGPVAPSPGGNGRPETPDDAISVRPNGEGDYAVDAKALEAAAANAGSGPVEIRIAPENGRDTFRLLLPASGVQALKAGARTTVVAFPQGELEIPAAAWPGQTADSGKLVLTLSGSLDTAGQEAWAKALNADSTYRQTGVFFTASLAGAADEADAAGGAGFAAPVTVRLSLKEAELDPEYAGVYALKDGKPVYIGGAFDGDEVAFETTGASGYTVLEYRKAFADMNGSWAQDYAQKLAAKHIVKGIDDSRYGPSLAVTRAEFATMLVRALGYLEPDAASAFADVKPDAYYAGFVAKASELGIVKGSGGRFRPTETITREEAVVMLMRAYERMSSDVSVPAAAAGFADLSDASSWAADAIRSAQAIGLVDGKAGNRFDPQGGLSRAELAKLVYTLLQK